MPFGAACTGPPRPRFFPWACVWRRWLSLWRAAWRWPALTYPATSSQCSAAKETSRSSCNSATCRPMPISNCSPRTRSCDASGTSRLSTCSCRCPNPGAGVQSFCNLCLAQPRCVRQLGCDHSSRSANAAWQSGWTGAGVGVAVIDSGIFAHDELKSSNGQSRIVYSHRLGRSQVCDPDEYKQEADGHGPPDPRQTHFQSRCETRQDEVENKPVQVVGTKPLQDCPDDAHAGETDYRDVQLRLDLYIDSAGEAHTLLLARVLYSFSLRSRVRREIPSSPAATSCLPPDFSSASRITRSEEHTSELQS